MTTQKRKKKKKLPLLRVLVMLRKKHVTKEDRRNIYATYLSLLSLMDEKRRKNAF